MKKYILFLLIAVLFITPAHANAPAPIVRAIRVVLVEPPGEAYDPTRASAAQTAITNAASFWAGEADLTITSTQIISPAIDVYSDLTWSLPMLQPGGDVTIFVLDNHASNRRLPGGDIGAAQDYYRAIWVAQGGDVLPAVLAHELGHVVFGLPDWYRTPGACAHPDIMCGHVAAYQQHVIGCASLAWIGAPCQHRALPLIAH